MLSKEQHIHFWKLQADDDWEIVAALFQLKKYPQCLFWAHLVLEKYCKALWIKENEGNVPPKTHNLNYLLSQTLISLTTEQQIFLLTVNKFQIEGRYPDYIANVSEICTESFTQENLQQIKQFKSWISEQLQ